MTPQEMTNALCFVGKPRGMAKNRGLHTWDVLKYQGKLKHGKEGSQYKGSTFGKLSIPMALIQSANGMSNKEIAKGQGVAESTVSQFLKPLEMTSFRPYGKGMRFPTLEKAYLLMEEQRLREKAKESKYDERRHWSKHTSVATHRTSKRYHSDPAFRLRACISSGLRKLIGGRTHRQRKLEKFCGCSLEYLKAHIESQFTKGMGWHNSSEWHIDHIMPKSLYDHADEEQVKQAWNWQNLQPLWAADNLTKMTKITRPQQYLVLDIGNRPKKKMVPLNA